MSRLWIVIAALFAISTGASAQDDSLVNVYNCYADGECAHAVTSQEWTAEQAELVIGEPAPAPDASIVCLEGGDCVWSPLSETEIEIANGGDGVVEPIEVIDIDGYPAELLDLNFDEDVEATDTARDGRVWMVICENGTCRATRSKITRSDAEVLFDDEHPEGDFYILCDEDGCRWVVWDADIQPLNGEWFLETHAPQASNCPVGGVPLESLVTAGQRDIVFSEPVQPIDIFTADTGTFDSVQQAMPSQNSYVLSLGVGSGQFGSRVIYDWTVVTEAFAVGSIVIDIPSISGGRCIVYIPWEMQHSE